LSAIQERLSRDLGFDLLRATEAAAISAGRWMGLGNPVESDRGAIQAMADALDQLDIWGHIVIGEEGKLGIHSPLDTGRRVGSGRGPEMDLVVDPIDGTRLLAMSQPDVIAVAGAAPRGSMWSPFPAVYMDKIVVDRQAAAALVAECIDAPAAWTLALVARVKQKAVRDLVVFVLDRVRHQDLIAEIRATGARILLRAEGDIAGALMAASIDTNVDLLMGVGGVAEGVIAACAVKSLGGAMLGRLAPQSEAERDAIVAAGLDTKKILTCDEMVSGEEIFFAATGITGGALLAGVRYQGAETHTESLVLRCQSGNQRIVKAVHKTGEL
jgi:fructose-1,6-bisphosphatase II